VEWWGAAEAWSWPFNVSDKSYRQNQNTFMLNKFVFSVRLWDNVKKYCRDEQTTDGNCALHAEYLRLQIHTQYMYYISTATMVARTFISVTFYVHCLSFYLYHSNEHHMSVFFLLCILFCLSSTFCWQNMGLSVRSEATQNCCFRLFLGIPSGDVIL